MGSKQGGFELDEASYDFLTNILYHRNQLVVHPLTMPPGVLESGIISCQTNEAGEQIINMTPAGLRLYAQYEHKRHQGILNMIAWAAAELSAPA